MSITVTTTPAKTGPTITAMVATFTADVASDNQSKVWNQTGVSGTSVAGVTNNTIDKPKRWGIRRPKTFKSATGMNTITGQYASVPKNVWKLFGIYSVNVGPNQVASMPIELTIGVPAGAVAYDTPNIEGNLLSFHGMVDANISGIIASIKDGAL